MIRICFLLILCSVTICGISCKRSESHRSGNTLESIHKADSIERLKHIGTLITEDSVIITSSDGKDHYIGDLALNDKIIVRFSVFACKPCVDFIVNGVSNRNDLVVFIAKSPVYDLHVYEAEMNCTVFNVDRMIIDFDEGLTPYIFKIDDEGRVRDYYIPRRENPTRYMEYLEKHHKQHIE